MMDSDWAVQLERLRHVIDTQTLELQTLIKLVSQNVASQEKTITHNRSDADMKFQGVHMRMDRMDQRIDAKVVEQTDLDDLKADIDGKVSKADFGFYKWLWNTVIAAAIGAAILSVWIKMGLPH